MTKRLQLLLYFSFASLGLFAQDSSMDWQQAIEWKNMRSIVAATGEKTDVLNCTGCSLHEGTGLLPLIYKQIDLPREGKIELRLEDISSHAISISSPEAWDSLPSSFSVNTDYGIVNGQHRAIISISPIAQRSGKLILLDAFKAKVQFRAKNSSVSVRRSWKNNSVLNSADFYKIAVSQSGVHRLDFAFFESLGMGIDFSLADLRIYGNPGGMLPELSGTDRADDLLENPIEVVDQNGNNQLDEGDAVLFYAEGPDFWDYNEGNADWTYHKNIYDDQHHYFITTGLGPGKRIQTSNFSGDAITTSNSFDRLEVMEEDKSNPLGSGRDWFGEQFGSGETQNYSFSFPHLVSAENLTVTSKTIGQTIGSGTNSQFETRLNGNLIHTQSFSSSGTGIADPFAKESTKSTTLTASGTSQNIELRFSANVSDGRGWVDRIELKGRCELNLAASSLKAGQLMLRDASSVLPNGYTRFALSGNGSNLRIWDVSSVESVSELIIQNSGFVGPNSSFNNKFIAFDGSSFKTAEPIGLVPNQNLHAIGFPDYILITHPDFIAAAEELAQFHEETNGLQCSVVTTEEVYNEFSSGSQDATAIRDFLKMIYDRSLEGAGEMTKYVLLLGDATFDHREITHGPESNRVPSYHSESSVHRVDSYVTDDYFGFLDDNEGANLESSGHLLDVALGRFPVKTIQEAMLMVNKVKHYKSATSKGPWLNNFTMIADDEDGNLHFEDAEKHYTTLQNYPQYNINKIYFDATQQVNNAAGESFPFIEQAISEAIFNGSFIVNYVGHGSETLWGKERVLTIPEIRSWDNYDKMPLFVTATCSFSKYDDPDIVSAGEEVILNPNGGGVAIVTTTRVVFAQSNRALNNAFLRFVFEEIDGEIPAIGTIMQLAKNDEPGAGLNNRKFLLLGDPAMQLNYPKNKIVTTSIENESSDDDESVLQALSSVTITGVINDSNGQKREDFNGTVYPVIYDKTKTFFTLGNDLNTNYDPDEPNDPCVGAGSCPKPFDLQNSVIFRGNATVEAGEFSFSFLVPKDISYEVGNGKISYYANDGILDAQGYDLEVKIGGIADSIAVDEDGPEIEVYMNDERFIFGGLTDQDPTLYIKLKDESGINTTGSGIGHDLTAIIDGNNDDKIILNNAYQTAPDSYQEGTVRYPLSDLSPGLHQLSIKAWDVYNNSGEGYTEFVVAENAELALDRILNYPNPFSDKTSFWVEHNRVGDQVDVRVQIFTVSGRLVKTLQRSVLTSGYRIDDLDWNGTDEFGNKIASGVYVYVVSIKGSDGKLAQKTEKLVILK